MDLLDKQAITAEPKPKVDADISLTPVEMDEVDGTTQDTPLNDMRPMVQIGGKMYYDTGKISSIDRRCGVMDGEITSTVDGTKSPTKDNQSNFGSGYEYQFVAENTVEIIVNEKWCVLNISVAIKDKP